MPRPLRGVMAPGRGRRPGGRRLHGDVPVLPSVDVAASSCLKEPLIGGEQRDQIFALAVLVVLRPKGLRRNA